jgi:hypothetical protein
MTTLRKAHVNCPKCGHGFTVRDNGGLTPAQADRVWKAVDEAFAAMDRAFAKMRRIWK